MAWLTPFNKPLNDWHGRSVWLVGASSGIGLACAKVLHAQGAKVCVSARQAALLRDDALLLDELAASLDPTDAIAMRDAPLALARRAIRRWLTAAGDGHPPSLATVDRVLAVAAGTAVACDVGDGRRVQRHRQRLELRQSED
jgi:NAD(P)-dependent dehydrogenase (short-subunit alcohol dehydrogenase family)